MGFFTTRERSELGKSAEIRVHGQVRELVRRDFVPPRRRTPDTDLAGHVGSLMERVAEGTLQEIDDLIAELRRRREQLLGESARVQRAIIEYAQLSQSTMQSTKIITESLAYWNKVPDVPGVTEPPVEDRASEEPRDGGAETFAQPSEDHGLFADQAEATAVPGAPTSETT
jgi:hypothetical protein